ncbi:MBG domain-containing protein [Parapedobacter lycopersici]|uniref:MBG domain-containing protein n=1 Tax=Parapedobacter lycopersici TaxID=1864939 RepID=UPI003342B64C
MKCSYPLAWLSVKLFVALGCCILGSMPAKAQFTVVSGEVVIKPNTLFSVQGLTFTPAAEVTFTNNALQRSDNPVAYAGSPSVNQVYTFDVPIAYTGTLRFPYTDAMLTGEPAGNLKLIYASGEEGPFTLIPQTVVNESERFAEHDFETSTTLQQVSALVSDVTPPVVTVVAIPANGYYVEHDELVFTVDFSENITVDVTGGTPYLNVTIGTATAAAAYVSGSGSSALVFRYTVQAGDVDLDGIALGSSLELAGGTIRDAAGNDAVPTLNNSGPTDQVLVYAVQPSVAVATAAISPVNGSFTAIITFSEAVTGFSSAGISVTNATLGTLQTEDNIKYTVEVSPLADGPVSLSVSADAAQNMAANGNTVSNTLNLEHDGAAPAVPVDLAAEGGDTEITLTWTGNTEPDVMSYRVYGSVGADPALLLETIAAPLTAFMHTGLVNGTEYRYRISAVDAAGNEGGLSMEVMAIPMGEQVITFGALPAMTYGDNPLLLGGIASSGLELSYSSSNPAIASVAGRVLTVHTAGQVTITAMQDGDVAFHAADPVAQVLTIDPATLAITAEAGQGKVYGTADPVLTYLATGFKLADDERILTGALERAPGEDAAIYAIAQGMLDAGSNYTIDFAGADFTIAPLAVTVTADGRTKGFGQPDPELTYRVSPALVAGDGFGGALLREPGEAVGTYQIRQGTLSLGENYIMAFQGAELEITPSGELNVTLSDGNFIYDGGAKSLRISGDLPWGVTVSYENNSRTDVGSQRVTATVRGANYENLVLTADLTITPALIAGITLEEGNFVYDGTWKSLVISGDVPSGVTVSYENNSRRDVGSQRVTAVLDGGANYGDLELTATLTVTPAERTLDFPAFAGKTYGDADFAAGAVSSSGEEVSYTSSDSAVAEIRNGQIHITGVGTATITATVPANGNYTSRPSVSRVLRVAKASQVITFDAPSEVNRDAGSIVLDVSSSSGLPVAMTVDDGQVATLEGSTLVIHRLGTVRITATQEGDANHDAAGPVTATIRVVDPSADFAVRIHPAVSPNGDGINEFLMIEGIRDFPENKVTLFSRNGTIVWEAKGYDNLNTVFRGTGAGGLQLTPGTYFYLVEVKAGGRWEYRKGYFVLRY